MSDVLKREVVFLLPTTLDGQQGPVAGWLNAAGWVTAAAQLGYRTTVISTVGLVDPLILRQSGSQPRVALSPRARLKSKLPLPIKTAVKDIREWIRSRNFARVVDLAELPVAPVAFVWQRHELFQSAGAAVARRLGCPFVLYVPAPKVWEAHSWGVRRPGWEAIVQRFGDLGPLRQADIVACVSEEVADEVVRLGIDPCRIVVTPSTVDTELFNPDINGTDARRRYSLDGRFVVGWTGSFRSFHGLDLLLDAISEAKQQLPEIVAMLVGDGPERSRLETEVRRRGLEGEVRFTGNLPQTEVPEVLSTFDVAIVSSRANQPFHYSPLKMWEYLATARAVVAPSVGSLQRLLEHGVNAILVEPGNVHSLADAITRLAGNPSLRLRLGRAGRELAEAASWTHQLKTVIGRLESPPIRG
jgi:glycosyltransferase involved in cell wall biosynthesis